MTDWVLQDAGADAWKLVLPDQRMKIVRRLFAAHGVNKSTALSDYVQLCQLRRAERLKDSHPRMGAICIYRGCDYS